MPSGFTLPPTAKLQLQRIDNATVRARPGRLSALSVSHSKSGWYGVFVWRAGRSTDKTGGVRPGQFQPLEFVPLVTLPKGYAGLLYLTTFATQVQGGCPRQHA
jgi:hypothetical protein